MAEMSDLIGGVMVVVDVAKAGERFGELKLVYDAVMLLCQSARNVTVMRALPVADWLQVKMEPGNDEQGLARAERLEARVAAKGIRSPSPPRDQLVGNAGALANWATILALQWARTGKLFGPVAEGGLGVTPAKFNMSGYLTDSGGMPAGEYQRHVAAARNRTKYKTSGIEMMPPMSPMGGYAPYDAPY